MKKILFILLLIFLGIVPRLMAQFPNQYNDLKIVANIDSLEQLIKQLDKNNPAYYRAILSLEKSRETFRSCYIGKYTNEIERLSNINKNEWGIAYALYLRVLKNLNVSKGEPYSNIEFAKKALILFEKHQDKEAIFLTHLLIINCHRLQLNKFGLLFENKEFEEIAEKTKNETYKLIEPHLNYCKDYVANYADDLFKIKFYIFKISLWNTIWLNKQNNDSSLMMCNKILETIGDKKALEFFKADVFNLKGNIYYIKNRLDSTIQYHIEALKFIVNDESTLNILLYSNIGNEYIANREIEKAYPYLIKCIENNKKKGNIFPSAAALAFRNLGNEYYANIKKDYHAAYVCLDSFIQITEPINNQSRIDEFKNFNTQASLNEKIQREKILKIKNRQSKQGLIAVSLLFLLSGIALINVIRSRKKLSRAYQQIQELQHSREKFYSIVAHDLKSPLNSYQEIASIICYLLKKKDYRQIEKISQKIDDNGAKIQLMLQNLFEWSLTQQQNLGYTPKTIHLKELYKDILPVYHHLSEIRSIGILEQIESEHTIEIDPNYLSTIIRNLLDNAIKNSFPNSIIQFKSVIANQKVLISISNSGDMSSEKLLTIQKLFSSDQAWSPGQEGIGLGLILIRDFAHKMKARIRVEKNNSIKSARC